MKSSGLFFLLFIIANVISINAIASCESNYTWTQTGDNIISFTNASTGTTIHTKYFWGFGDGSSDTLQNPVHTYDVPGAYYVCLHIEDSLCSSYFCDTITVTGVVICNITVGCYEYEHATCDTCANGVAHSYASGGTEPYSYLWDTNPVQTTSTAEGLLPGAYTVCATDANGCSACCTVTIDTPSCEVSVGCYELTHASCDTCADGVAHSYASGGTEPYSYVWDTNPVQTTSTAEGLLPGTYTVCATDVHGCSACCTVTIDTQGCEVTVGCYELTHASCDTCADGVAHSYASGGTEPYSFVWDTNPIQTTSSAEGLLPGTYTVCATDVHGCSACCTVTIDTPSCEVALACYQITPASCDTCADGVAHSYAYNGTEPYSYVWDTNPVQTTSTASGLLPGTYSVCATDVHGCSACCTMTVSNANENCSAYFYLYPDSSIAHLYWAVNMTAGVEPITYLWSWGDGTNDSIAYPHHTYDTAGYYTICLFIHDASGCSDTLCHSYELQKPSSPNEIITVNVIPNIPSALQNINVLKALSVFPNPAHNTISINYTLSTASQVAIALYDVLGNRMHYLKNDVSSGEHRESIDVSKLSNGIYVVQIQTGDEVVSRKIAVMN